MNIDLEIISEEGDCPDPLFDSIMNAMNSMKEATADKIYQKIQREGETNYSKPQVDRALASALKYGIFEVRNNRYRVRDDIIDDEDTVYWKLQKKREQTPFRIHEDERQHGPKLDPEKDRLRFKKMPERLPQCSQCGRIKRPAEREYNGNPSKKSRKQEHLKNKRKRQDKIASKGSDEFWNNGHDPYDGSDRTMTSESLSNERSFRTKKTFEVNSDNLSNPFERRYLDPAGKDQTKENVDRGKYDSSDSEVDSLLSPSDDEQSFRSYPGEKGRDYKISPSSDCEDIDHLDNAMTRAKRSTPSLKSDNDSVNTDLSSQSGENLGGGTPEPFYETLPCTSKNAGEKKRNQHVNASHLKDYEREAVDHCDGRPDWLGCSDEPQGTIIQTNNILTIEPMDSLAFKSPEQASYIS